MTCPFGFDPFDTARGDGFEDHVDACTYCAEVVAVAHAARRTWRAATARDETTVAPFREQRLLRGPLRSPTRNAPLAFAFAAGAMVAILVARRYPAPSTTVSERPQAREEASVPAAPVAEPAPPPASLVVVAHRGVSLAGFRFEPSGKPVTVPRGAHLALGFSIDAPLVDIEGPASVRGDGAELTLDEGTLDVAGGSLAIRTAAARVRLEHAACRVAVTAGETRIERRAGVVVVEGTGQPPSAPRTIADAPIVVVSAEGTVWAGTREEEIARRTPRPAIHRMSSKVGWTTALARLDRGDRDGAEVAFRSIANDPSETTALRARAAFRSGELALGRQDRATGAAELTPLLDDADPELASDAALLLARAASTPGERAAIWDRLLARDLPEPYRTHALRQRASSGGNVDRSGEVRERTKP